MAELKDLVSELMSLNNENLSKRVINDNDVQWCLSELYDMLAADVVEVVRCKDCVRRNQSADLSDSVLCTWLHNLSMPKDGYCSYGESEDKQNETD